MKWGQEETQPRPACPVCVSVNREAREEGSVQLWTGHGNPIWEPRRKVSPVEAADLNLGGGPGQRGITRLLQYNDFHFYWEQDVTAATTKHNQPTRGTWEGNLGGEAEGGSPGDGRGPGDVATPTSNTETPLAQSQGELGANSGGRG